MIAEDETIDFKYGLIFHMKQFKKTELFIKFQKNFIYY